MKIIHKIKDYIVETIYFLLKTLFKILWAYIVYLITFSITMRFIIRHNIGETLISRESIFELPVILGVMFAMCTFCCSSEENLYKFTIRNHCLALCIFLVIGVPILNVIAKSYLWLEDGVWYDFYFIEFIHNITGKLINIHDFMGSFIGVNKIIYFTFYTEAWLVLFIFGLICSFLYNKTRKK